jgi:hypothetical protein
MRLEFKLANFDSLFINLVTYENFYTDHIIIHHYGT